MGIKRKELDPRLATLLTIAEGSRTYEEYCFRCQVADVKALPEYMFDMNRYGYVLKPDPQCQNSFLQLKVED